LRRSNGRDLDFLDHENDVIDGLQARGELAVAVAEAFRETVQAAVPLQTPLQPAKVKPGLVWL